MIRLDLTNRPDPMRSVIDQNTGDIPIMFKGSTTHFQVGLFDTFNVGLDLDGVVAMHTELYPTPVVRDYLGYQPFNYTDPIVSVITLAEDIRPQIERGAFLKGLTQNYTAVFPYLATRNLDMAGLVYKQFQLVVYATFDDASKVIYCAAPILVKASNAVLETA